MLKSRAPIFSLVAILSSPVSTISVAQTDTNAKPIPPLQINVRNVLVDVVVTDKKGTAIPGLRKEDFEVRENGKRQKIEFFEPHFPSPAAPAQPAPSLPPNTFTNVPRAEPNQAINILLMDALNTTLTDQMYVRRQMIKYLATLPPGLRVGVFLLSDRLRIIQGFTDDSGLLRASIDRLAGKPTEAAMEATPNELATQSTSIGDLNTMASGPGGAQLGEMISTMQNFLATSASEQKNQQLLITLDALQVIAHYVSAVPGRKNLIWFVGSFPLCLPPGCPYDDNVKRTIDALAAARVSVYPIDAGGVFTPNADIGGAGHDQTASLVPGTVLPGSTAPVAPAQAFQLIASENWAQATGGIATHHNDLKGALAEDIANGSSYYTIAYTPTDSKEIGRERNIEIRVPEANYKLLYRRAYFERTPAEIKAASVADHDPLRPLMDRGMPNFPDLHFSLHIDPWPAANGAPHNGDNPALKPPLERYTVRFFLSPESLKLVKGPDGISRAPVEVALIAYSQRGESLNWLVRSIDLAIRPDQMTFAQSNGIPFHFDFDIPPGDVYLRGGVYDPRTQRAGTLEIPMAEVKAVTE